MKCNLCKDPKPEIIEFDDQPLHVILAMRKDGHVHVHAPWDDEVAVKNMARAFMAQLEKHGIVFKYNLGQPPGGKNDQDKE